MPVYKDAERSTWYVSFSVKDKTTGKFKHKKKRGFKTAKEAKEWEAKEKSGVNKVADISKASGISFREMSKKWEVYLDCSEESVNDHTRHFAIRFSEFLDRPIADITKQELVDWKKWLANTSFSTITKNKTLSYVRGTFKFANELYDIPNIATVLKNFKKTDEEVTQEMEVWTPEEFSQFIACVDEPEYKLFFEFLFWTGCRRGEAIALQRKHVKNKTATLRYSQKLRAKGLKPTKTKNVRTIALDDILWEKLQPYLKGNGYVFGNPKGLHPTSIATRYSKAIKKSGVKYIKLHNLRHSHATWLICNGVNIVAVSKRLGHASITQTLETYTHLLKETDLEMMMRINSFRKGKEEK